MWNQFTSSHIAELTPSCIVVKVDVAVVVQDVAEQLLDLGLVYFWMHSVSWQESQPFQVVFLVTSVEKHISCALPPVMAELKLD